jgi:hypothetical protein
VRDPSPKLEDKWNEKFRLLQEYHAEHGDCLVPWDCRTANKIKLGTWVSSLRKRHAAGKLKKDRLIQLESLGFSFRALPDDSLQAKWDRLYERLVQYKRKHGDCLVPSIYEEDLRLGEWVSDLRKRRNTLSADQRAALEALGFTWVAFDAKWQAQFEALERFKKQYGHCSVTNRHEAEYPGLPTWVRTKRQRRGRDQMDGERMKRLDGIGFRWFRRTTLETPTSTTTS